METFTKYILLENGRKKEKTCTTIQIQNFYQIQT